jgi:NADH-quinone oxidoreductase subunit L
LRQLRLVIINISVGLYSFVFFHLLTHALFKVILFMCAGGVIHSKGDSQDIHFVVGLLKQVQLFLARLESHV